MCQKFRPHKIEIINLPGLIDIFPFITQNLDYKSLINLKLTCKKFSSMVKSEDIIERKGKENCEERNKIRMVWLKQPFPYFEAYRSYYSVCLPFK